MDQSDAELLQHYAVRRDEGAFAQIVRRHGPLVRRVARRILRDEGLAEDAAQAAFLVLARRAPALGREAKVAAFLHGVVRRTAFEILRTRRRNSERERKAIMAKAEDHDHARQPEAGDLMQKLDRLLAGLPEDLRTAVVLRHIEGLDQAAAARVAGCPQGTLAWRTSRGLELLRRRLRRDDPRLAGTVVAEVLEIERAALALEAPLANPLSGNGGTEVRRLADRIARGQERRALVGRLSIAFLLLSALSGLAMTAHCTMRPDGQRTRASEPPIIFRSPAPGPLDWRDEVSFATELPTPFRRLATAWRGRAETAVLPPGEALRPVAPGVVRVAVELRDAPGAAPWSFVALEHRGDRSSLPLATSLLLFRGSLAAELEVGDEIDDDPLGLTLADPESGDGRARLILVLHDGPWRQVSPRFLAESRMQAIELARLAGHELQDETEISVDWLGDEAMRFTLAGRELVQVSITQTFSADPAEMPALPVWCQGDDPEDQAWRKPSASITEEYRR